jgi:hypothetical protein
LSSLNFTFLKLHILIPSTASFFFPFVKTLELKMSFGRLCGVKQLQRDKVCVVIPVADPSYVERQEGGDRVSPGGGSERAFPAVEPYRPCALMKSTVLALPSLPLSAL